MKQHRSLRFNISFSIVLMMVLFAASVIYFNYTRSKKSTYEMVQTITLQVTQAILDKTDYYLHKSDSLLRVLARYNSTNSVLNLEETNVKMLWDYLNTESHLASIFLADESGNFLQARKYPKLAVREIAVMDGKRIDFYDFKNKDFVSTGHTVSVAEYDPRTRPWYKDAKENHIHITKPYFFASTGEPGITVSYANIDRFGNKICVAAVDIALATLFDFIKEQASIIKGQIILFNTETDELFLSSEGEFDTNMMNKDIKTLPLGFGMHNALDAYKQGQNIGGVLGADGRRYIYSAAQISFGEKEKISLILSIPEEIVFGDVRKNMFITVAISLFILSLFIILAIQISKMISRPIVKLSQEINQLAQLNLDVGIKEDSKIKEIYLAQKSLATLKSGLESFKKYMPADLVKILIQTKQEAKIGGVEKPLVVMFTDIEGFTTISEKLSPMELTTQLSVYFEHLEKIISKYEGTIDKYIGDAIMAFWGAPLYVENPAHKAVQCALEMQKSLDALNSRWEKEGKPPLRTRIGIHYGKTLVGNIGSNNRMNYTIIGDSVNIAARLEGINKNYKTQIMISEEIEALVREKFLIRYVDEIELKGKTSATKIYTIESEI